MSAQIPRITADLISALAGISQLERKEALPQRCHVIQAIAERGAQVDALTVGELLQRFCPLFHLQDHKIFTLLSPVSASLDFF